jgi:hypothetical protein
MVAALARGRSARGEPKEKCSTATSSAPPQTKTPDSLRPRRWAGRSPVSMRNLRRNEERMLGRTTQQAYTRFAQLANALSLLRYA